MRDIDIAIISVCLSVCLYVRHVPVYMQYCHSFYRATRMHSADYAMASCLSVRLFVHLSVTHRYSVGCVKCMGV